MKNALLLTLVAITPAMACKGNADRSSDTAGAARAAVTITSPTEGATTGKDVTVALRSEGVTIAKTDGKKVEGVGHYHLFLDTAPTPDNTPIPPTTSTIVHLGTGDSTFTFKGLPAGPHRIIAVIGYGDHSPMPGRRDSVDFTVKP